MEYTVRKVSELTGVTVRALHHYHKIGLLQPYKVTNAGYRIYRTKELERLQQILFYRELDFSLTDIQKALENEESRISCLKQQYKLLIDRQKKIKHLLNVLEESIQCSLKGEGMEHSKMFKGLNRKEWDEILSEQKAYLCEKYEIEINSDTLEVDELNELGEESEKFLTFLTHALVDGWKPDDNRLQQRVKEHLRFLSCHSVSTSVKEFVETTKFFIEDDFHREMLESQQIGLSYYLYTTAQMYETSCS